MEFIGIIKAECPEIIACIMEEIIKSRLRKQYKKQWDAELYMIIKRKITYETGVAQVSCEQYIKHLPSGSNRATEKMDVTLCASVLLYPMMGDELLFDEIENKCVRKLRDTRNDMIHGRYTSDEELWKESIGPIKKAKKVFASELKEETKTRIANYIEGRLPATESAPTAPATVEDARVLLRDGDGKEGVELLRKLATENENAEAMIRLSRIYRTAEFPCVEEDLPQAVAWMKRAIQLGDARSAEQAEKTLVKMEAVNSLLDKVNVTEDYTDVLSLIEVRKEGDFLSADKQKIIALYLRARDLGDMNADLAIQNELNSLKEIDAEKYEKTILWLLESGEMAGVDPAQELQQYDKLYEAATNQKQNKTEEFCDYIGVKLQEANAYQYDLYVLYRKYNLKFRDGARTPLIKKGISQDAILEILNITQGLLNGKFSNPMKERVLGQIYYVRGVCERGRGNISCLENFWQYGQYAKITGEKNSEITRVIESYIGTEKLHEVYQRLYRYVEDTALYMSDLDTCILNNLEKANVYEFYLFNVLLAHKKSGAYKNETCYSVEYKDQAYFPTVVKYGDKILRNQCCNIPSEREIELCYHACKEIQRWIEWDERWMFIEQELSELERAVSKIGISERIIQQKFGLLSQFGDIQERVADISDAIQSFSLVLASNPESALAREIKRKKKRQDEYIRKSEKSYRQYTEIVSRRTDEMLDQCMEFKGWQEALSKEKPDSWRDMQQMWQERWEAFDRIRVQTDELSKEREQLAEALGMGYADKLAHLKSLKTAIAREFTAMNMHIKKMKQQEEEEKTKRREEERRRQLEEEKRLEIEKERAEERETARRLKKRQRERAIDDVKSKTKRIVKIAAIAVVGCITLVGILFELLPLEEMINERTEENFYNSICESVEPYMEEGDYIEAYHIVVESESTSEAVEELRIEIMTKIREQVYEEYPLSGTYVEQVDPIYVNENKELVVSESYAAFEVLNEAFDSIEQVICSDESWLRGVFILDGEGDFYYIANYATNVTDLSSSKASYELLAEDVIQVVVSREYIYVQNENLQWSVANQEDVDAEYPWEEVEEVVSRYVFKLTDGTYYQPVYERSEFTEYVSLEVPAGRTVVSTLDNDNIILLLDDGSLLCRGYSGSNNQEEVEQLNEAFATFTSKAIQMVNDNDEKIIVLLEDGTLWHVVGDDVTPIYLGSEITNILLTYEYPGDGVTYELDADGWSYLMKRLYVVRNDGVVISLEGYAKYLQICDNWEITPAGLEDVVDACGQGCVLESGLAVPSYDGYTVEMDENDYVAIIENEICDIDDPRVIAACE